jgi:hypothetical protein
MTRTSILRAAPVCAALSLLALACSGSGGSPIGGTPSSPSSYEAMFESTGAAATPDKLDGLWAGTINRGDIVFDVRLRFSADSLTAAARCEWDDGTRVTAGAKGRTRTTPRATDLPCLPLGGSLDSSCGEVQTLESVTNKVTLREDRWCSVSFMPRAYDYTVAGTKARFGVGADWIDLVKISD